MYVPTRVHYQNLRRLKERHFFSFLLPKGAPLGDDVHRNEQEVKFLLKYVVDGVQIAKCFRENFTRRLMAAVKAAFSAKKARSAGEEAAAVGQPRAAEAPRQRPISPEEAEGEEDGGRPKRASPKVRFFSCKSALCTNGSLHQPPAKLEQISQVRKLTVLQGHPCCGLSREKERRWWCLRTGARRG